MHKKNLLFKIKNIYYRRKTKSTTIRKPAKRTLLAFTHDRNVNTHFDKLYLRDADNNISAEYKVLTNDFYIQNGKKFFNK